MHKYKIEIEKNYILLAYQHRDSELLGSVWEGWPDNVCGVFKHCVRTLISRSICVKYIVKNKDCIQVRESVNTNIPTTSAITHPPSPKDYLITINYAKRPNIVKITLQQYDAIFYARRLLYGICQCIYRFNILIQ